MTIENVIMTTDNCRYCLMCRHVCPVGSVTHRETLNPHGWGLVIASIRRKLLVWNEETVRVLYACADCGTCRAHCVTDQPLPEAIAAARAETAGLNLAPPVAYQVNQALEQWSNPYVKQVPQPVEGQGKIALFVGDEAPYLWKPALEAAQQLLRCAGVEPVLVGWGRNNGYLASSLGFPDTARDLARETIAELQASGAELVLVLSPGDYFTFQQLYPERLGVEWPAGVQLQEVTVFLANRLEAGKLNITRAEDATPYTYVDPTHSVRVPTHFDAPRKLLAAILPGPARELFWRRERAHPTGSTALQFTNPEISHDLTRARLEDIQKSGAILAITEDPGSLKQLSMQADQFGLRVQGLYELLAAQLPVA